MTHSIDAYLGWSRAGRHYEGQEYYWSDSWSTAASVTGFFTALFVTATITLGILSDPEAIGLPNWPWQLSLFLTFLTLGTHTLMYRAYDARSLNAAGNWAFRKFLELPAEVQAELGGRDAFLSRLKTFTLDDTKKVIGAIESAQKAHDKRIKMEAQLQSHPEDFMEALDRYTGQQKEYVKTLKELS